MVEGNGLLAAALLLLLLLNQHEHQPQQERGWFHFRGLGWGVRRQGGGPGWEGFGESS